MIKFYNIQNWSRLGREEFTLEEELDKRPKILLSQFSIFGFLGALINVVIDSLAGSLIPTIIDIFLVLLLAFIYWLNENQRHKSARYIFLISLNVILFVYANLVPKEIGIYLIFFPLIGGTYIFLGRSGRKEKIFFTALPISILFILELSNYQLFGPIDLDMGDERVSFFINLTIATVAFAYSMHYLLSMNQRNEKNILQNRDEFKKLATQIEEKNTILKKANEELDRFVYSASHDLRSPLMSILGLIMLMKKENDPAQLLNYTELIEDRVNKLDSFIKEIIEYSRNARTEVVTELVDLRELTDTIIEDHEYHESARKINFRNEVNNLSPIRTDKQRLKVIFNNLVSNAIKYHDFSKEKPEICFRGKEVNGNIHISIIDNGSGIREEDKERIFDMFYRGSEKSDGTGLGLYIAKEIADKLQGSIILKTEFGHGSEFILTLPAS